jgi:hypothetical protein
VVGPLDVWRVTGRIDDGDHARLDFSQGGETLSVLVDRSLDVADVDRSAGSFSGSATYP